MAAKQTRRAISVKMDTYDDVSKHAEDNGLSRSGILEKLINKFLDSVDGGDPADLTASRLRINKDLRR